MFSYLPPHSVLWKVRLRQSRTPPLSKKITMSSSPLCRHPLHHSAYVLHCGTVYRSPIGRLLIAWRLSRKKKKKKLQRSKQRKSFVNSLLLLAADLALSVMPVLLEHTHTSYCYPSLAGLCERTCVAMIYVSMCVCICLYLYVLVSTEGKHGRH